MLHLYANFIQQLLPFRHWLQGPKAGKSEIFVEHLPGMPDNIRNKDDGGYYVSLVSVKSPETFDELKFLAKLPWLRKLMLRFVNIAKVVFDTVTWVYPNMYTEEISFKVIILCVCICYNDICYDNLMKLWS